MSCVVVSYDSRGSCVIMRDTDRARPSRRRRRGAGFQRLLARRPWRRAGRSSRRGSENRSVAGEEPLLCRAHLRDDAGAVRVFRFVLV